jgi:hypothetical protein
MQSHEYISMLWWGGLFSAIQVESIRIHLVVQTPIAFNLPTINHCIVGKIEEDTARNVISESTVEYLV